MLPIKKSISRFLQSSFVRNAGGLVFASVFSRCLGIVSVMLLSRVYSQDDIGVYFVFVSYAMIFSTVSILCYHQAFPNAKTEEGVRNLFKLILLLATISLCGMWVVFEIIDYRYSLFLAIYVVSLSLLAAVEYYFIRVSEFLMIVLLRIMPSVMFLIVLIYVGSFSHSSIDDLVAYQVLIVVLVVGVAYLYLFNKKISLGRVSLTSVLETMGEFKHFAVYLMPSQLLSVAAYNLPTIILDRFLGSFAAAQWGMVVRLCFGSVGILSDSIAKSYHAKLAQMVRGKKENIEIQFNQLSRVLFFLGVVVWFGMIVIVPNIVPFLFAGDWSIASQMIMILSPMFGIMMLVMPLSTIFVVLGYQRYVFWNQLSMFLISIAAFGAGVYWNDIIIAAASLSVLNFIRYVFIYLAERTVISSLKDKQL